MQAQTAAPAGIAAVVAIASGTDKFQTTAEAAAGELLAGAVDAKLAPVARVVLPVSVVLEVVEVPAVVDAAGEPSGISGETHGPEKTDEIKNTEDCYIEIGSLNDCAVLLFGTSRE